MSDERPLVMSNILGCYILLEWIVAFKIWSPAIAELADHTALYWIAVQHADDGYSRRGMFGGSLVHNMFLIYSSDGTNVSGSRGRKFKGAGSA